MYIIIIRYSLYRILQGIEKRGFLLAHYEPNYFAPKVLNIEGIKFHLYCETLWLNPSFVKAPLKMHNTSNDQQIHQEIVNKNNAFNKTIGHKEFNKILTKLAAAKSNLTFETS